MTDDAPAYGEPTHWMMTVRGARKLGWSEAALEDGLVRASSCGYPDGDVVVMLTPKPDPLTPPRG